MFYDWTEGLAIVSWPTARGREVVEQDRLAAGQFPCSSATQRLYPPALFTRGHVTKKILSSLSLLT